MNLVLGRFVTTFNDFAIGAMAPDDYMKEVSRYAFFLVYIHTVLLSLVVIRATSALRMDFLQSFLRQDMTYFDSNYGGSPSIKVTANGNLVTNGISERLSILVQSCSTFVAAFVVAFAVQWKLTLITLGVVPTIVIVTGVCMTIEVKSENVLMSIWSQASLLAEGVFSSITTVHAFWLQPTMARRYEGYLAELECVGKKKSLSYGVLFATQFFCVYAGYGLAFWQGVRMFARGEISDPGQVVTYCMLPHLLPLVLNRFPKLTLLPLRVILAIVLVATSLTQIAPQVITITKAATAADELFRIIDTSSAIDRVDSSDDVSK
ncbi:ABC transporter transmembrane region-domain-containing protein [Emericellopsis atlantica]|uniref:ABC transporter transmembrane region-domain-containing protein n=1 Tax=Emericellopsis atlantica TaxID=2614577 RepID=A0A9P7ZMU0_9HYPO|nr:ABC transporter transmembrane region-domain-containing protein [Emericellopsis atlantica]KAG9254831.1 ABC transporter transmembrane region-domain-containing protein [Emericellopsis atlantica]